jgi:hypothetical protein
MSGAGFGGLETDGDISREYEVNDREYPCNRLPYSEVVITLFFIIIHDSIDNSLQVKCLSRAFDIYFGGSMMQI